MIVSWVHDDTGRHEIDTETASLPELREARRALQALDALYYWERRRRRSRVPSVGAELKAVKIAIAAQKAQVATTAA